MFSIYPRVFRTFMLDPRYFSSFSNAPAISFILSPSFGIHVSSLSHVPVLLIYFSLFLKTLRVKAVLYGFYFCPPLFYHIPYFAHIFSFPRFVHRDYRLVYKALDAVIIMFSKLASWCKQVPSSSTDRRDQYFTRHNKHFPCHPARRQDNGSGAQWRICYPGEVGLEEAQRTLCIYRINAARYE